MLTAAKLFLSQGIKTIILDNHPPDPIVESEDDYRRYEELRNELFTKYRDNFFYHSTTENCTAGIAYTDVYEPLSSQLTNVSLSNMQRWALIGLTGDVSTESAEGGPLYQRLLKDNPYLSGLFMSEADGADYNFGVLSFYAKIFHIPRRMLFDAAPDLCLNAMREMESIPNWLEFNRLVATKDEVSTSPLFYKVTSLKDAKFETINSYTKMLLSTFQTWDIEHGKADGKGKSTRLHYDDFDVTVLSHKWNLGSSMASKWAMITAKTGHPKAQFVINDIPNQEIHISGRGPKQPETGLAKGSDGVLREVHYLHIGKVFKRANPDIMKGGGLQPAGSAKGLVNDSEVLLNELVKAVERSRT